MISHFTARLAVLVVAVFALSAATPAWQPAYATKIEAVMNTKSTFVVAARVALPNSCYNVRIEHRVPTDPKSPGYFVEQQRRAMVLCGEAIENCIVTAQFIGPIVPHSVVVASRRLHGSDWELSRVIVAPHGSSPTPTCKQPRNP
jgi:hypothetical protein